jgi:membrane protein implicated in regulation of membrane protease activity
MSIISSDLLPNRVSSRVVWSLVAGLAATVALEVLAPGGWRIAAVTLLIFAVIAVAVGQLLREKSVAEQELREARVRHRNLVDALPHYIFSVDTNDRYIALNAHSCRR